MPVSDPQLLLGRPPFFPRPHRPRPGAFFPGMFGNVQQQQPAVPATPAVAAETPKSPEGADPQSPDPATPAVSPTGEVAVPKNPGSLFTPGASMGSNTDINGRKETLNLISIFFFFFLHLYQKLKLFALEVLGILNGGQLGSATAGGAGNGAVQGNEPNIARLFKYHNSLKFLKRWSCHRPRNWHCQCWTRYANALNPLFLNDNLINVPLK